MEGCPTQAPMKNIGLFSRCRIGVDELTELGLSLGGRPIGNATLRFGQMPDEAYLDLSTNLSNGCFDEDEFKALELQLGYPPVSYVSIHMNYTGRAFSRALEVARAIQARWGGDVDYSGAGGLIDNPFSPPT